MRARQFRHNRKTTPLTIQVSASDEFVRAFSRKKYLQRLPRLWRITGAAELRGRTPKFPLEDAIECRFRRIADFGSLTFAFEEPSISAASLSRHRARYDEANPESDETFSESRA